MQMDVKKLIKLMIKSILIKLNNFFDALKLLEKKLSKLMQKKIKLTILLPPVRTKLNKC